MDHQQIASFVVRFHLVEIEKGTGEKRWRIKITHVQSEKETMFQSIDEAMNFMKSTVEEST